jgi:hypothetical protein
MINGEIKIPFLDGGVNKFLLFIRFFAIPITMDLNFVE